MEILCSLLDPILGITQQIMNIAWFPLSFFGFQAPSIGSIIGPILGCSF